MNESLIEKRLEYAHRYLKFDALTRDLGWHDSVQEFNLNPEFKLPEFLVLIHPRFMENLALDKKIVLGGDFPQNTTKGQKCRSKDVWGYECPYRNALIHVDHSFPRSRGGATHPLNAMYLCDHHNLMKSSDVHLYPWENLELNREWIDRIFEKICLAEKRSTGRFSHIHEQKRTLG